MRGLRGGLAASYFTNRWLHGSPVQSRIDATINFVWPNFVTESGKDFVSVRWVGYVLPAFSEVYTFYMQVNDGVQVWLDGDVIIDRFKNVVDDAASSVVAAGGFVEVSGVSLRQLKAGVPYDLKVEFREDEGLAVARLLWASASEPKRVVPASRLFYDVEPIVASPFTVVVSASSCTRWCGHLLCALVFPCNCRFFSARVPRVFPAVLPPPPLLPLPLCCSCGSSPKVWCRHRPRVLRLPFTPSLL
jgi:hypothetical protein